MGSKPKERFPPLDQKSQIEALLVASDHAVAVPALAQCLGVTEDETGNALREFEADLLGADRGI